MSAARLPSNAAFSARSTSREPLGRGLLGEFDRAVDHLAGLGDEHHQRAVRRHREQVDALDARERDARREHDREAVGEPCERHRRLAHELVDLGRAVQQARGLGPPFDRRAALLEQIVDEGAVARVGGHPPRRDVRLHDESRSPRGSRARCARSPDCSRARSGSRASCCPPAWRWLCTPPPALAARGGGVRSACETP